MTLEDKRHLGMYGSRKNYLGSLMFFPGPMTTSMISVRSWTFYHGDWVHIDPTVDPTLHPWTIHT